MTWDAVALVVPASSAELAARFLLAQGADGTWESPAEGEAVAYAQPWDPDGAREPERVEVRAWLPAGSRARCAAEAESWCARHHAEVRWWTEVDQDWVAQSREGYERIELGPVAVAPSWLAEPGDVVVEPGAGYGTAQHPSTRLALDGLLACRVPGEAVLDVGCGSGVLALVAARLGHPVTGFDPDARGIEAALDNARRSDLTVTLTTGQLPEAGRPAPLVLANLHAELLIAHAPVLRRLARRCLVASGIMAEKEAAVVAALGPPTHRWQREDWVALAWEHA